MKVCLCIPTLVNGGQNGPHPATLASIAASVPMLDRMDVKHRVVSEVNNPYISQARSVMLRKALDWGADRVMFIDHDVSWQAEDLPKLLCTDGDCVAGLYRFTKADPSDCHEYMGTVYCGPDGRPETREDGCIKAELVPGGFLSISRKGINLAMGAYPDLLYGERCRPHLDLFNHGAWDWIWYGEDYAMSRRWREGVGPIWVRPDLSLSHWRGDTEYSGNYHNFLRRQPGGDLAEAA